MKISCYIVEDDAYALNGLKKYIAMLPNLEVVASYTDPLEALTKISSAKSVDLLLMDIDMPHISGIELARELRNKTDKLVFTTSHSQYAYEAFGVEANAYLLKPYPFAKFAATINKLFPSQLDQTIKDSPGNPTDFFFVKSKEEGKKLLKVFFKDVIAVESRSNYVQIHTLHQSITTYMSLGELYAVLNTHQGFAQFHRSFILGTGHIVSVEGNYITMANGMKITVGELYRKEFMHFMEGKVINKTGSSRK